MLTTIHDVAIINNLNLEDFIAYCEQTSYAWNLREVLVVDTSLVNLLVEEYKKAMV